MTISINDLMTLRQMRSIADAQRYLAERDVPHEEWDRYTPLVGTRTGDNTNISIEVLDPLRHWTWTLLYLNGCTLRMIATYYNKNHSTVLLGIEKYVNAVQRAHRAPRCSLEHMAALVHAFALHRDEFLVTDDPFGSAERLNRLALETGD